MNEEEVLDRNYKAGKKRIERTIENLNNSIKNMKDVKGVITYGVDGNLILSIIKKLEKSKEQANYLLSRFNKLDVEIIVPWKLMNRERRR